MLTYTYLQDGLRVVPDDIRLREYQDSDLDPFRRPLEKYAAGGDNMLMVSFKARLFAVVSAAQQTVRALPILLHVNNVMLFISSSMAQLNGKHSGGCY